MYKHICNHNCHNCILIFQFTYWVIDYQVAYMTIINYSKIQNKTYKCWKSICNSGHTALCNQCQSQKWARSNIQKHVQRTAGTKQDPVSLNQTELSWNWVWRPPPYVHQSSHFHFCHSTHPLLLFLSARLMQASMVGRTICLKSVPVWFHASPFSFAHRAWIGRDVSQDWARSKEG